ncbi:MAG: hypothetical protein WC683_00720 [bacterium]
MPSMTRWLLVTLVFAMACAVSCSSGSGATYTMTLTIEESASAQIAKVQGGKAIDPSSWTVACDSTDASGNLTKVTAAYDSSTASFFVMGIPEGQATVCYLDKGNDDVVTLQYEDANVVGSTRDTSALTANGSGKITYDPSTNTAVVSNASGVSGTGAEDRTNYSTKWSVNCQDVRNVITKEVDASKSCPAELTNASIYLHLVMSEDSGSNLKTGYGVWTSAEAYTACGSTEGFDSMPAGWTLDAVGSPTQGAAFTWSAPFENFSSASASAQIITMIQGTSVSGLQTFAVFKADPANDEFCSHGDDICAARYYAQVVRAYGVANASSVCWPQIAFSFAAGDQATASASLDTGSTTRPLGRHQFMESFKAGNETYMHGISSRLETVMDGDSSVSCNVKNETLIAIITPGGDPGSPDINVPVSKIVTPGGDPDGSIPDPGTATTMSFNSMMIVKAVSGSSAEDTLCQSYLGATTETVPEGYYSKAAMVAESNPIPSP